MKVYYLPRTAEAPISLVVPYLEDDSPNWDKVLEKAHAEYGKGQLFVPFFGREKFDKEEKSSERSSNGF